MEVWEETFRRVWMKLKMDEVLAMEVHKKVLPEQNFIIKYRMIQNDQLKTISFQSGYYPLESELVQVSYSPAIQPTYQSNS